MNNVHDGRGDDSCSVAPGDLIVVRRGKSFPLYRKMERYGDHPARVRMDGILTQVRDIALVISMHKVVDYDEHVVMLVAGGVVGLSWESVLRNVGVRSFL